MTSLNHFLLHLIVTMKYMKHIRLYLSRMFVIHLSCMYIVMYILFLYLLFDT